MPERHGHGLVERHLARIHHILDELDDHLRVRLGLEMIALAGELRLQGLVVLNDTVVDQGELMILGIMGMRIDVARLAVRRPAGVGDARAAGHILVRRRSLQVLDLALGLVDDQVAAVVNQRHAGAVISPVLEPGQSLDQNRVGLPATDISNNTTHTV